MPIDTETIIINKKRYERLVEESNFLHRLYAAGVDNWEGYGEACDGEACDDEDDEDD